MKKIIALMLILVGIAVREQYYYLFLDYNV